MSSGLLNPQPSVIDRQESTLPEALTKHLITKLVLPVGVRTLERMLAAETFPDPDFRLGAKAFWRRGTVLAWLNSQTTNPAGTRAMPARVQFRAKVAPAREAGACLETVDPTPVKGRSCHASNTTPR